MYLYDFVVFLFGSMKEIIYRSVNGKVQVERRWMIPVLRGALLYQELSKWLLSGLYHSSRPH